MKRAATFIERFVFAAVVDSWRTLCARAPRVSGPGSSMVLTGRDLQANQAAIHIVHIDGRRLGLEMSDVGVMP